MTASFYDGISYGKIQTFSIQSAFISIVHVELNSYLQREKRGDEIAQLKRLFKKLLSPISSRLSHQASIGKWKPTPQPRTLGHYLFLL